MHKSVASRALFIGAKHAGLLSQPQALGHISSCMSMLRTQHTATIDIKKHILMVLSHLQQFNLRNGTTKLKFLQLVKTHLWTGIPLEYLNRQQTTIKLFQHSIAFSSSAVLELSC